MFYIFSIHFIYIVYSTSFFVFLSFTRAYTGVGSSTAGCVATSTASVTGTAMASTSDLYNIQPILGNSAANSCQQYALAAPNLYTQIGTYGSNGFNWPQANSYYSNNFYYRSAINQCLTTTPTPQPTLRPIVVVAPSAFNVTKKSNSTNVPANMACFAGSELVTLESGSDKHMSEVQIGDRILTVNNKGEQVFSDVVYLPHGANEERTTFTVVTTKSGRDLKMTANHILPAGACATPFTLSAIAASQVKVGDCVQTVSGREQVVSVTEIEGKGIYTVIAMEELIVVNGIVATPYGGVNPTLANIYYNMHRLIYVTMKQTSARWMQSTTEMVWGVLSALSV